LFSSATQYHAIQLRQIKNPIQDFASWAFVALVIVGLIVILAIAIHEMRFGTL